MELSPFVDSLRRDLAAAAGAVGGTGPSGEVPDDVRAASERLLFALDPSVRLVLLDALGSAAAEVGAQLDDAAVEVRLRGRDPELVVLRTDPPAAPAGPGWAGDVAAAFDSAAAAFGPAFLGRPGPAFPAPPTPPSPAGWPTPPTPPDAPSPPEVPGDDDGTARLTLRLPESLKARTEQAAAASGLSVNAWLVRAVSAALDGPPAPPPGAASRHPGRRLTGWAR